MKCKEASEITAYLRGEGTGEERAMLRRHYEDCDPCTRELRQLEKAHDLLGQLEGIEPSPDFASRVQAAFLREHPQYALPRPRFRLLGPLAIAAAQPATFDVLAKPSKLDTSSWEYVSQNGTNEEALAMLPTEVTAQPTPERAKVRKRPH